MKGWKMKERYSILNTSPARMEPRVRRIYTMMLGGYTQWPYDEPTCAAETAQYELETLIELKEAEVKWILNGLRH